MCGISAPSVILMTNNNMEIVHQGWLTKSPPQKRILKGKWRRRWFLLRQSGELPGQYFLEYYTDQSCKKLKGTINLDQCERVDAGLTFENQRRQQQPAFMFDVQIPRRTYYLSAESEDDMNRWVECICQVCGLKVCSSDEYVPLQQQVEQVEDSSRQEDDSPVESPPLTPVSLSGPYIPISECITGKPVDRSDKLPLKYPHVGNNVHIQSDGDRIPPPTPPKGIGRRMKSAPFAMSYEVPRPLHSQVSRDGMMDPLLTPSDRDSVGPSSPPAVNWDTYPRDSATPDSQKLRFPDKVDGEESGHPVPLTSSDFVHIPARPPKPSRLMDAHNYLNLDSPDIRTTSTPLSGTSLREETRFPFNEVVHKKMPSCSSDTEPHTPNSAPPLTPHSAGEEVYDFPRSHNLQLNRADSLDRRHCYNNAAPGQVEGTVFRYDNLSTESIHNNNLRSQASYTNLPSPCSHTSSTSDLPPTVDRTLKPRKKNGDSTECVSCAAAQVLDENPEHPPLVKRDLKPRKASDSSSPTPILLGPPPVRPFNTSTGRRPRAAPSPTPPSVRNGVNSDEDRHASGRTSLPEDEHLQYLDIDFESNAENSVFAPPGRLGTGPSRHPMTSHSNSQKTEYKQVDFLKTNALNKTQQVMEQYRKSQ